LRRSAGFRHRRQAFAGSFRWGIALSPSTRGRARLRHRLTRGQVSAAPASPFREIGLRRFANAFRGGKLRVSGYVGKAEDAAQAFAGRSAATAPTARTAPVVIMSRRFIKARFWSIRSSLSN
jgi:hypothetical protein